MTRRRPGRRVSDTENCRYWGVGGAKARSRRDPAPITRRCELRDDEVDGVAADVDLPGGDVLPGAERAVFDLPPTTTRARRVTRCDRRGVRRWDRRRDRHPL